MTLPTEPYKGVRDFYPEDLAVREHIFRTMRRVAHAYGYEEYDASILEPTELYAAKSGEEIVSEQTYSFTDRGDRNVSLRPEMTPTTARLVARKSRELPLPLRWFSIPNVFRYERPQRGRLREHWQLNLDIIGSDSFYADLEVLLVARDIMYAFGAKDSDFEIRLNHRGILDTLLHDMLGLDDEISHKVRTIIDKKHKIDKEQFEGMLKEALPEHNIDTLLQCIETQEMSEIAKILSTELQDSVALKDAENLMQQAHAHDITNIVYDGSLVRGFDYYTGMVFEVFDTNPENNRSLFGGGRFDGLTALFGADEIPAVGFGMGDVTIADFLRVRDLLPAYGPPTFVYVCVIDDAYRSAAFTLADELRANNINATVDISGKKVGDQIQRASKSNIPYIVCVGEKEAKENIYTAKELATSNEEALDKSALITYLGERARNNI